MDFEFFLQLISLTLGLSVAPLIVIIVAEHVFAKYWNESSYLPPHANRGRGLFIILCVAIFLALVWMGVNRYAHGVISGVIAQVITGLYMTKQGVRKW